ncbi:hypothetical protein KR222_000036, partial [Zaprionus bogoriensis]
KRRHRQIAYLAICSLSVIIFGFALTTLIRPAHAADLHHDSTHEQMGQAHFAPPVYSAYEHKANYTKETKFKSEAMHPVYNFTHFLFDNILTSDPALPPGYIVVKDANTLALGPKVENNDWQDLLKNYWLVLIWVIFLLILVIVIPFIAVCYCCFCCCRNCKEGCPPCDSGKDARKRCCYGLLLLLLIIGILFGVIIAFVTNRHLDDGFESTSRTLRRGSEDTCTYLKDVSDHIRHMFVNNYEELETHLIDQVRNAHNHIFLDLMDVSEANALEELERILNNMEKARATFAKMENLHMTLLMETEQLKDMLRGVKRDVNYACAVLCANRDCLQFLKATQVEYLDTSTCLNLDKMPKRSFYLNSTDDIETNNTKIIITKALGRVQEIGKMIKTALDPMVPPTMFNIQKGRGFFREHSDKIRNIIDAAMSDIHLGTVRSTKSFEDVYDKFGTDRSLVSVTICVLLLVILIVLVIALMCGCCGRRRHGYRDDCCSKGTGATCLLLAILLIFCVFSLIVLVGLFYFVMGMLTYQGACAPLRDQENNTLFRQLDKSIDLNKYLPQEAESKNALPPFRMSKALKACRANQTVFQLLQENSIYDINNLMGIKLLEPHFEKQNRGPIFTGNLSNFVILEPDERLELENVRDSNLSTYHSAVYTTSYCKRLSPVELPIMINQLKDLRNRLWSQWGIYDWARTSLENEAIILEKTEAHFVPRIKSQMDLLTANVTEIDKLILYENKPFGKSIDVLLEATKRAEDFIRTRGHTYINALCENLTLYVEEQMELYVQKVIKECTDEVGNCAPLSYIYNRSVDLVCSGLVDPMNGFWVGVLLCALLFLPVLFVSHRLLCLYKKIDPYSAPAGGIVEGGSDYLYDAYSEREREHVPLANVPKKRRKAYERRREQQDYYEDASPGVSRVARGTGSGAMNGGASGDAAAGSSNMRYNDVAPTHWDHEPPRYHNPPVAPPSSEYERPPPYYYPGASDQD